MTRPTPSQTARSMWSCGQFPLDADVCKAEYSTVEGVLAKADYDGSCHFKARQKQAETVHLSKSSWNEMFVCDKTMRGSNVAELSVTSAMYRKVTHMCKPGQSTSAQDQVPFDLNAWSRPMIIVYSIKVVSATGQVSRSGAEHTRSGAELLCH